MTPCKTHKWIVERKHSVFGLKNVNAILQCKTCKTGAYLGLTPNEKFDVRGDRVKTYFYEGEVPADAVSVPKL